MVRYISATSKAEATARMYLLADWPVEALGPGSKEKKSSLVALGRALGMDLDGVSGKTECGRLIAEHLHVEWDASCYSAGDTITLTGMNRLVDGAAVRLTGPSGSLDPARLSAIVEASRTVVPHQVIPHQKESFIMPVTVSEIEQNIAERLAALSAPGPVPQDGLQPSDRQLEAADIRFDDGTWRRVVELEQGWMKLAHAVSGGTPEEFDGALASALGEASEELTGDALMERLANRLERAVTLRDRFCASLEGTAEGRATLETATQEWIDAWVEVEEEEEAEVGGPIKATADVWAINEFVQRAEDGGLNLSPSYQRADVWPTGDAQLLIESVLRGIPLPSVILLEEDDEDGVRFEVVDGKQRLTSILRFMGHHPRALELVRRKSAEWGVPDLERRFKEDYPGFRRLWKQKEPTRLTAQTEKDLYFPFPLRSGAVVSLSGDLEPLRGKYYSEIRDVKIDVVGKKQHVRYVFEQASVYKVPVILYEEVSGDQIHEVFSLYNKQGKHLNAEEIRNARFHSLALMRGVLATAGDAEDVATVAPFLTDVWEDLASTPATLDNKQYGFGRAGYKRTKLLSWVSAVLFADGGPIGSRSTAGTINALFERISKDRAELLRREAVVRDAMLLLDHALDAHAAVPDAWPQSFRNSQSSNGWQELQLISTLIALAAAHAVLGDDLVDRVEESAPEIAAACLTRWSRPTKTQSAEQWRFTALVARELLEILGVDADDASGRLQARFGSTGLRSLLALSAPAESRS